MANIAGHYDEEAIPSTGGDPIPAGEYRAVIEEAEVDEISTRAEKGRCLVLTWKVQGGEFDGRLFWQRLNMWAENFQSKKGDKSDAQATADAIAGANRDFAQVRGALGFRTPENPTGKPFGGDTNELLQIPAMCRVIVKTDDTGQYKPSNEVKAVKPIASGAPASRGPAPTARGPAPGKAPAASAGKANPFGHLKSGAQQPEMVNDDIPF